MVCAFFKQGLCSKGDKCKFSHDISLERKGEKRSIYVDSRDVEGTDCFFSESLFMSRGCNKFEVSSCSEGSNWPYQQGA